MRGNRIFSLFIIASLLAIEVHPTLSAVSFSVFDLLDDLVLVLMILVVMIVTAGTGRVRRTFFVACGWAASLIILSLLLGRNPSVLDIVIQGLSQTKFFVFVAFALLFVYPRDAAWGFRLLLYISILGGVLNVIWPGLFIKFGLAERFRLGDIPLPRIGGFQLNANRLGRIFALVPLTGPEVLRCSRTRFYILLAISCVLEILTGSRVSSGLFVMGLLYRLMMAQRTISRRAITLLILLPFLVGGVFLGAQTLRLDNLGGSDVVGEDAPIFRVLLVVEGIRLAVKNFPFGTGLASYGTPLAYDVGVYEETIIATTPFFRQVEGLYDNNWASILGETGFLGLLLTLIAYWNIIDRSIRHIPSLLRFAITCFVMLTLGFESLLQNAITSAAFVLFLVAVVRSYQSSSIGERSSSFLDRV